VNEERDISGKTFCCTGGWLCEAKLHVHGCYMDVPPAYCDQPNEHRPKWGES
jgi:hypothetical protein